MSRSPKLLDIFPTGLKRRTVFSQSLGHCQLDPGADLLLASHRQVEVKIGGRDQRFIAEITCSQPLLGGVSKNREILFRQPQVCCWDPVLEHELHSLLKKCILVAKSSVEPSNFSLRKIECKFTGTE